MPKGYSWVSGLPKAGIWGSSEQGWDKVAAPCWATGQRISWIVIFSDHHPGGGLGDDAKAENLPVGLCDKKKKIEKNAAWFQILCLIM